MALATPIARAADRNDPVPIPSVTPVPASAPGHAENAVAFQQVPFNLAATGYVEQEYFISGSARIYQYDQPNTPTNNNVNVLRTNPYVDRILVRKPADPTRFSGNVVVEIINGGLGADLLTVWPQAKNQFIANGDAWIGVTVAAVAIESMKAFNPQRYAPLSFASNATSTANAGGCAPGGDEVGIAYDVISQVGALARSTAATSPLAGYNVRAVFAGGYSLAALDLDEYVNAVLPSLAASPYDAYFIGSGGLPARLNNCQPNSTYNGRSYIPGPLPTPVFQTQTPSETELLDLPINASSGRADSDAPTNRYRYYPIPGSAHVDGTLINGLPQESDVQALTGNTATSPVGGCLQAGGPSTFPDPYVYDNLWAKLEAWVRNGTLPPHAAPIGGVDQYGNLQGGVRSVALDVPIAAYFPGGQIPPTSLGGNFSIPCSLFGYSVPLAQFQLNAIYRSQANYAALVGRDAASLVGAGFLTPSDAAALIAQAHITPAIQ